MGVATAIAIGSVVASGVGAISANQKAQKAKGEKYRAQQHLESLENARQEIINPYAGVEDVSGMAEDLSGMLTNRYNNIGVATQAAEIKIEQADIALANTLDTLAATGASAGGATALAQAALNSKRDVAASIESQEQALEAQRVKADMQLDRVKMAEAGRIQGVEMAEAKRIQQAEVAADKFQFQVREQREAEQLDRAQAEVDDAKSKISQYQSSRDKMVGGSISAMGSIPGAIKTDRG